MKKIRYLLPLLLFSFCMCQKETVQTIKKSANAVPLQKRAKPDPECEAELSVLSSPSLKSLQNEQPKTKKEDYFIMLDTDKVLNTHTTGEIRVWIGLQAYAPPYGRNQVRDEKQFSSQSIQYARITPYAPDFEINPGVSECIKIVPEGSSVRFAIKATKQGDYKVSATVEIFDNPQCKGERLSITSETLTVQVKVDNNYFFRIKVQELKATLWEHFTTFATALIGLGFSVLLFRIRRRAKN